MITYVNVKGNSPIILGKKNMKTYDHRKISQIYKKKTLNILSLKSNYIKDFCSSKGIQRKRTTNWKILITYIKD